VQREPVLALDGGADGLDTYRTLAPELRRVTTTGGLVALEIGAGQADDVEGILVRAGLEPMARHTTSMAS